MKVLKQGAALVILFHWLQSNLTPVRSTETVTFQIRVLADQQTDLTSKNIQRNVWDGYKRLKYRTKTDGGKSVFFPLKVLMCHVLFKLPSAGTPIYTSPWGPIPLHLPSSIHAASHSSITHSSICPSTPHLPSRSIHPWRTEDEIREETIRWGGREVERRGQTGRREKRRRSKKRRIVVERQCDLVLDWCISGENGL